MICSASMECESGASQGLIGRWKPRALEGELGWPELKGAKKQRER